MYACLGTLGALAALRKIWLLAAAMDIDGGSSGGLGAWREDRWGRFAGIARRGSMCCASDRCWFVCGGGNCGGLGAWAQGSTAPLDWSGESRISRCCARERRRAGRGGGSCCGLGAWARVGREARRRRLTGAARRVVAGAGRARAAERTRRGGGSGCGLGAWTRGSTAPLFWSGEARGSRCGARERCRAGRGGGSGIGLGACGRE